MKNIILVILGIALIGLSYFPFEHVVHLRNSVADDMASMTAWFGTVGIILLIIGFMCLLYGIIHYNDDE